MRKIIFLLFLCSGISGLIYEVVWTRVFSVVLGNTVHAISLVLAVFMAGLALGGFCAGKIIDKRKDSLRIYALLEIGVGISAFILTLLIGPIAPWYAKVHQLLDGFPMLLVIARGILVFIFLGIPTALMGATLPVLSRFVVERESAVGLSIGALYGINTLGAATGCFMAGFWFIGNLGIFATTIIASVINISVGAIAWRMRNAGTPPAPVMPSVKAQQPEIASPLWRGYLVVAAFAISGFASMGYEIAWTRILVAYMGNSVYAFSAMLTAFLVGIAMGSWLCSRWADRIARPMLWFGAFQIGIGLYVIAIFHLFGSSPQSLRPFMLLAPIWHKPVAMFFKAFMLMLPPTLLMGASFPLAGRLYARNIARIGSSISHLYVWNTVACIAGSLLAGFVLVPYAGMEKTLLILVCVNAVTGTVLASSEPLVRFPFKAAMTGGVAILFIMSIAFAPQNIIRRVRASVLERDERIVQFDETMYGTVAVVQKGSDRSLQLDGLEMAGTADNFLYSQKALGHLPLLLHPDPRRVFVIGFGGGGASYAIGTHPCVRSVDIAELSAAVVRDAPWFDAVNHGVLGDPRFSMHITDGRHFLMTTAAVYDVISVDLLWPQSAGAGGLYTREFYASCARHLADDGIMVEWIHPGLVPNGYLRAIVKTAAGIFPYVSLWWSREFSHVLLAASRRPALTIDYARLCERMRVPAVQRDLARIRMDDPAVFASYFIAGGPALQEYAAKAGRINTDDLPLLEFHLPLARELPAWENLRSLAQLKQPVSPMIENISAEDRRRIDANDSVVIRVALSQSALMGNNDLKGAAFYCGGLMRINPEHPEAKTWCENVEKMIESARMRDGRNW